MTRNKLQSILPQTPDHFVNRMEQTLKEIENMNPRNLKHDVRTPILVAAILLALSCTALAVGSYFGIFDFMANVSGPITPLEDAEDVIETDVGQGANANGTIVIEEAAYSGDNYSIVIHATPANGGGYGFPDLKIKNAEFQNLSLSDRRFEDGSISFFMQGYVHGDAPETLDCEITMFCGEWMTIPFQITHVEGLRARLIPQSEGERWSIVSATISFGKLSGTLDVKYLYEPLPSELMGVDLRMLDANGEEYPDGGGGSKVEIQPDGTVIYHSVTEIQSLAELPAKVWIRPKVIDEIAHLETIECLVIPE